MEVTEETSPCESLIFETGALNGNASKQEVGGGMKRVGNVSDVHVLLVFLVLHVLLASLVLLEVGFPSSNSFFPFLFKS